jgi:drug/metabolite transporter (DMT)-like permease
MKPTSRYTLYVLISAFSGAAGVVLTEVLLRGYSVPVLHITIVANIAGGVFLLLSASAQHSPIWQRWLLRDWLRLFVASLATFAVGFLLLYKAVDLIGSSKTTLFGRLEVIFIVALAVVFLGEKWSPRHWVAGALALTGAALINFDPSAYELRVGRGELLSLGSVLSFSVGIILLKSLVDRLDGIIVTGFGLLFGAVLLIPVALYEGLANAIGTAWVLALLLVRGLFLGISWVTYNVAMKHLGASRCSVLFLSIVFFTVVLQLLVNTISPQLELRVPDNLAMSALGGVVIGGAVFVIHSED